MLSKNEVPTLKSVEEAAHALGVGLSTMYDIIGRKEIGHHRGRGLGIKISDQQIAEYLAKTKQEPAEPVTRKPTGPLPRLKHLRLN